MRNYYLTKENSAFTSGLKNPSQRASLSSPSATPESVRRRRFVSLPRPSDMPSAQHHVYKYTGEENSENFISQTLILIFP